MIDSKTKSKLIKRLGDVVGLENLTTEETDGVLCARDAWRLSAGKLRAGEQLPIADVIVFPASTKEVSEILIIANEMKIPVIPVGGGAGVCGGTLPVHGGIQLDLKRMNKILDIDHQSMTVRVQAGVVGIDLDEEVSRHGYITGHTPTSSRASCVGGFVATRSAGSMSSLYGKIEDLTLGLEVVLPNGEIVQLKAVPRSSVGPDLRQLFIGSEGTLGVITEATLRLFPAPEKRSFRSMSFPDVHSGLEAIREILQDGIYPSVVRFYDADDTAYHLSRQFDIKDGVSMLLLAFDGNEERVRLEEALAVDICLKYGATDCGEAISKWWWEHRYDMYYPNKLIATGYTVTDTIDIVATYDKLERIYYALRQIIESNDSFPLTHFSHMYPNGGSMYMIIYVSRNTPKETWKVYKKIWDEAVEACIKEGGTISHQHGVGLVRSSYVEDELTSAFPVLQSIKKTLDPNGIMNPGKLGFEARH